MDNQINLLIVDDKEENIIALEALLRRPDINLVSTTSPNEALRICWEKDIAVALIDVQMPEMDGFELVEILKSNPRTCDMLIIFVTAISKETKFAVKGYSTGAVDYLYKPLDPYVTSAKVDSFIQLVRTQRDLKRKNIELENYQKDLIKAKNQAEQAKRIKENFLANMSHEIRTPINGIIGLAHLLKSTELDDYQQGILEMLDSSSQSLLGVINDILDISKIEAGKFKIVRSETNIAHLSQSVISLLQFKAKEKNIELKLEVAPELPYLVLADSLRLNQILMNLISNGIKFTEEGYVKLELKVLAWKGNNAQIAFTVSDSGIGIAEDKIRLVFDSFEQAEDTTAQRFGGTGLGLSIVKKLSELKGGLLSVTSEMGKGSTFTFTNWYQIILQINDDQEVKKTAAELPKFEKLSILVAEDNAVNLFMIKKILNQWNIQVDSADDGTKVLDKVNENDYDLILMDTHMPVMSGFEATRRIRSEMFGFKRDIPIISLSAAVLEEEQKAALAAGVNDVLSKPFDPVTLYYKIEKLVRK
ncbi:response regulator [Hufsiella ginkgonis]|uniref:Sensory/regulatory protein RpfC n=1 Tax=Hufsiella ginkgonis TaxID=2695274 RepID=A0A7K1XW93_9SPHI|nr:response regulator [Hufsiella ginkgonis]MXV15097.1 response regulator [Hufsiella ginkgonis]